MADSVRDCLAVNNVEEFTFLELWHTPIAQRETRVQQVVEAHLMLALCFLVSELCTWAELDIELGRKQAAHLAERILQSPHVQTHDSTLDHSATPTQWTVENLARMSFEGYKSDVYRGVGTWPSIGPPPRGIGLAGARATFLKACIVKELSNHLGLPQLGVHCEEIKDEIARGVGGCFNTADAYHEAGNLLHGCSTTFLLDIFDPEMVGTRTISWQEVYRLGKKWGYFSIAGGRLTPTRAVELVWHLPVSRVSIDSGGSE